MNRADPQRDASPHVAVIGAGPSGIAACKTLREYGLPVTCYEAGDRVGGQWVLGNSSGTSAAYRSLRTNTHKGMSRFSDFALPDDHPDFPSHEQMAAWFDSYVDHFDFRDRIRFRSRVECAQPHEPRGFTLTLEGGEQISHDALVVASGNLWEPRRPDFPGTLDGTVIHAKDYLDPCEPVDCRGKRVLVVGLGNTACELAVELSEPGVAAEVFLSARSGQTVLPRVVAPLPHPSDPLTGVLAWTPPALRRQVFERVFGRMMKQLTAKLPQPAEVGLPPPPANPTQKRAVLNNELLPRCRSGRIQAKPAVQALEGAEVAFADGSREKIDVVITATGYRLSFPFFRDTLPELERDGLRLAWGVRHPARDDLFVIGVMQAICSIWPRSEQQMRFVAPFLAREAAWPSQRAIDRATYPVLGVPFGNCQIYTAELQRELRRRRLTTYSERSAF